MTTAQKVVTNLINDKIFPLNAGLLKQDDWYLEITNLCQNTFHM